MARERDEFDAAHKVLVDTASAIAERAPDRAALLLYDAMTAAWVAGHHPSIADVTGRVAALGLGTPPGSPPYLPAVDGLARLAAGGPGRARPPRRGLVTGKRNRVPRDGRGARAG
ncbi:hypothetical protein, partial [Streptomyces lasiicapitis]|uniref:hypothetical protein n=1 Tax=Streptomyces lasiicapitis TaxID=1923961 RepID=UPI003697A009